MWHKTTVFFKTVIFLPEMRQAMRQPSCRRACRGGEETIGHLARARSIPNTARAVLIRIFCHELNTTTPFLVAVMSSASKSRRVSAVVKCVNAECPGFDKPVGTGWCDDCKAARGLAPTKKCPKKKIPGPQEKTFAVQLVVNGCEMEPFAIAASEISVLLTRIEFRLGSSLPHPEFQNSSGNWVAASALSFEDLPTSPLYIREQEIEPVTPVPGQKERIDKNKAFIKFMKSSGWIFSKIPRDGNCLFSSYIAAFKTLLNEHEQQIMAQNGYNQKGLRSLCAKKLLEFEGIVPNSRNQEFEKSADGSIVGNIELVRGDGKKNTTLQEYCQLLGTTLYGGDLEIALISYLFDCQTSVYSAAYWDGQFSANPEVFGRLAVGPDSLNVCLLFEEALSGGRDHFYFIQGLYQMHDMLMERMPIWGKDIVIADCKELGRGLKMMKELFPGDPIGWYDGHHVDADGNVVWENPAIAKLMQEYPAIDRRLQGTPFQATHAVRLNRSSKHGFLIDGGPLAHPAIDHVPGLGRMAIANSASPAQANMFVFVHSLLIFDNSHSFRRVVTEHAGPALANCPHQKKVMFFFASKHIKYVASIFIIIIIMTL